MVVKQAITDGIAGHIDGCRLRHMILLHKEQGLGMLLAGHRDFQGKNIRCFKWHSLRRCVLVRQSDQRFCWCTAGRCGGRGHFDGVRVSAGGRVHSGRHVQ